MNNFSDREEKETNYMLLIFDLFSKFETCPFCQIFVKSLDKNEKLKNHNPEKIIKLIESNHNKRSCFILSAHSGYVNFEKLTAEQINKMAAGAWTNINELIKERDEFKKTLRKHKK